MLKSTKQTGASLIELSIILLIMGAISSIFFIGTQGQLEAAKLSFTRDNVKVIETALVDFVAKNGRLPCPANISLSTNDSQYGLEQFNDTINPAACNNAAQITDGDDVIYYGAIPVRSLNLPSNMMLDGWNNKLSYVVQRAFINNSLTNSTCSSTPSTNHISSNICLRGQASGDNPLIHNDIWIFKDLASSTFAMPKAAIYLIVSHGSNGLGGYNRSGVQNPLPDLTNQQHQLQNSAYCITNSCSAPAGEFVISAGNTAEIANFDDILFYKTREQLLFDCNKFYNNACIETWGVSYE
jgi:type II secretory pathway pseudopilin PulG